LLACELAFVTSGVRLPARSHPRLYRCCRSQLILLLQEQSVSDFVRDRIQRAFQRPELCHHHSWKEKEEIIETHVVVVIETCFSASST
jgi:hypothetical protein